MKKFNRNNIKHATKNETKFLYLKDTQIELFKNFIKKNHSKTHIFVKSKKVFDYFYKNKTHYNFVIATDKNKILGVQGFIPYSKFDKNLKKTCFLAYWRVARTNNIGIGLRLFRKIKHRNYNFIGVVGINENLLNYHKWQGFNVGKLNHHFFVNKNINRKITKHIKPGQFIKRKVAIKKLNYSSIKTLNKNVFKFQIPKKTAGYLINRYLKNKFYDYYIYSIKNEKSEIILVFRKIKHKKLIILKIIDVIGDLKQIGKIGNALKQILEIFNAEYIDIYSYGISEKILNNSGFINRYKTKLIIPDHFEPFENKNIDINYAYISNDKTNKICLFKGDGDMDRPSRLITLK